MQCTNLIVLSSLLNIQRFLLTPSLTDDEKEDETANDRVKLGSILGAAFTFWRWNCWWWFAKFPLHQTLLLMLLLCSTGSRPEGCRAVICVTKLKLNCATFSTSVSRFKNNRVVNGSSQEDSLRTVYAGRNGVLCKAPRIETMQEQRNLAIMNLSWNLFDFVD